MEKTKIRFVVNDKPMKQLMSFGDTLAIVKTIRKGKTSFKNYPIIWAWVTG